MPNRKVLQEPEKFDLDEMIDSQDLTNEERKKISSGDIDFLKNLLLKSCESIPGIKFINGILEFTRNRTGNIRQQKLEKIFKNYLSKTDNHEKAISMLCKIISNPWGHSTFLKILQLVDKKPPEEDYLDILSNVLKNMSEEDFEKLFEEHHIVLSILENLSIQSVKILLDERNWPLFQPGHIQSLGQKVVSDWTGAFTEQYYPKITADKENIPKIHFFVNEIRSLNLVFATSTQSGCKLLLTEMGSLIVKYLR